MRSSFLPFSPPLIGEEEIAEVVDTLRSDWITTGPKTKRFEEEFRSFTGAPAALALNSCTAGLHLALAVLGVGPGDEIITTTMTFAASVNVIEHVGATPVLVDVEPDTLNICPERVREAITPRTRAIMAVHYAGHPCDVNSLMGAIGGRRIDIVEDAAHALPAEYKGHLIGSGRNLTAFSFYATKNMTTAEGGMLTGPREFIDRARMLSLHGMSRDAWKRYGKEGNWFYEIVQAGFKYNMTDIQAALGICQLRKLLQFQERRRSIVEAYDRAFRVAEVFDLPARRPEVEHAWHLYVLRLRGNALRVSRNQFIEELKERNIGTSVHFIPIHLHPFYRDKYSYKPQAFPIALSNYERMVSIPLNPRLTDQDVADVIEAVLDVVRKCRR